MYCPECGTENPDDSGFCGGCGLNFSEYHSDDGGGGDKKKPPRNKLKAILITVFAFLLLTLIFLFISSNIDLELPLVGRLQIECLQIDLSDIDLPDWLPYQEEIEDGLRHGDGEGGGYTWSEEDEAGEALEGESMEEHEAIPADEDEEPAAVAKETKKSEPSGHIVYTCQVDQQINHDQICIMDANGSHRKQLTDDLSNEHYYASFTKDGSKIVFSSSLPNKKSFNIFIMDSDGSNLKQLTSGMGDFYAPAVSPDGKHIVATRYENGTNHIALLTSSGDFVKDLNSYFDCKDPVWSPDGSEILFAANPNKTGIQFYVMDSDGSDVRKVTNMDGLRGRSDWSVDGTMASYTGETSQHNRELFLFGENRSTKIITDGGDNLAPSFSPDGEWITFMSYRDNYWDSDGCEIYIMRLEDGYTKRLTSNNYCDYQPRWGK